jgi:hypothetical protein
MGQGRMLERLSGGLTHTIQEIRAGGTSTDARRDTSSFLDPNARLTAATTAIKISLVQNLDHPRIGCRRIKRRTRPNSGREGFPQVNGPLVFLFGKKGLVWRNPGGEPPKRIGPINRRRSVKTAHDPCGGIAIDVGISDAEKSVPRVCLNRKPIRGAAVGQNGSIRQNRQASDGAGKSRYQVDLLPRISVASGWGG